MYIPRSFEVTDLPTLHALMRRFSFATLISAGENAPVATPLPLLLRESPTSPYGTLNGHLARANPHWKQFHLDREALVIFQGSHSYISPSWYPTAATEPTVPTWNYVTIHAYGIPRIRNDAEWLSSHLDDLITTFEGQQPEPWTPIQLEKYKATHMQAIVGFELSITRLEGKFKLGQNRAPVDQQGVFAALKSSPDPEARDLAQYMIGRCALGEMLEG